MSLNFKSHKTPCLKGVTMQAAVRRLEAHRESGKLTDEALEAKLEPEDLELLEQRVAPTLWYPIDAYDRIMLLLRETEGGMGDDWWIRYGEASAAEILAFGPVQAMLKGARSFGPRAGIVLVRMSTLYFNFSKWHFEGESLEAFEVEVSGAEPMSEPCRLIVLGFLRHLAQVFVGHEVAIESDRPVQSRIIYRTPR
jgi:hypothetical protein